MWVARESGTIWSTAVARISEAIGGETVPECRFAHPGYFSIFQKLPQQAAATASSILHAGKPKRVSGARLPPMLAFLPRMRTIILRLDVWERERSGR